MNLPANFPLKKVIITVVSVVIVIALIINTVEEKRGAINDSRSIRTSGLQARVTMYTTIWGAEAAAEGIRHLGELVVYPIQSLHSQLH